MSFDAFQSSAGSGGAAASAASSPAPESSSSPAPASTPTPSSTPTPAPESQAPAARPAAAKLGDPNAKSLNAPETQAFQPNFKFKVMDQEREFDEFVRGAIKDADTEKKVRELYEKAFGLDHIKPRFHEAREQLKAAKSEVQTFQQGIQELREHYARGDFDSFFKRLQIPEEKVLQWVIDKAQYNQLPPDQRKVLDEKRAAEQKAALLEKQHTQFQQQFQEQATQAKAFALQVALEKPDVSEIAKQFDQRAGKPGAFRDAVIQAGEYAWFKNNVDLTPEQAIQQVLAYWGTPTPSQPTQPPIIPAQGGAPQPAVAPKPQATPTIPNVAGKQTTSVSKPKPKSIQDLKNLLKSMGG